MAKTKEEDIQEALMYLFQQIYIIGRQEVPMNEIIGKLLSRHQPFASIEIEKKLSKIKNSKGEIFKIEKEEEDFTINAEGNTKIKPS